MKLLGKEGADRRKLGIFYVAVVKKVLLFGSKTWVLTSQMENSFKGFHQRAVRRMTGMPPRRQRDGTWLYPTIGEALSMVGLYDIRVYIDRCQNTVAQ